MEVGVRSRDQQTVLVVDDDGAICALLAAALVDEGYRVHTARNGAEAVAVLGEAFPDVILLNLNMPVMDGRAFYAHLRSNGAHATQVVIISAAGARQAQRELGAEAAIEKPFDLDEVLAVVATLARSG